MVFLPDHRRFGSRGQRVALGVMLSAALHLLCFAGLGSLVVHPGRSRTSAVDAALDVVEVSTVTGAMVGPPAPPARNADAPAGARAAAPRAPPRRRETALPARREARRDEAAEPAARPERNARPQHVASVAVPAAPTGARPPPAEGSARPAAPSPAPPGTAGPPPDLAARAPAVIDVGDRGARVSPAAARRGIPGHSPRAAFLADLEARLRAAWRGPDVYLRIDPQGQLRGSLLITGLQVRLRANGTIEKAQVSDSSGFAALDEEAMAALRRTQPLPHLPAEMIDPAGGFDVRCALHLDVGLYRFANALHRAIAEEWRPSRAFLASGDEERTTVVRLMLDRNGVLATTSVVSSAGIEFLDTGALAALKPGARLPAPPSAFIRRPGPVPVFVAFYHRAGEVHVLRPREDMEAE
jgi:TonB family protein